MWLHQNFLDERKFGMHPTRKDVDRLMVVMIDAK